MSSYYSDHRVNNRFFNYGLVKKGAKRYRKALRQAKKTQKNIGSRRVLIIVSYGILITHSTHSY